MRWFVRILTLVLAGAAAFFFLGPMAPQGTFIREAADSFRQALNAWWGFPLGLPS